ncbi:hypothetical protein PYCC9005_002806 [Savitreella phatthalungensis]
MATDDGASPTQVAFGATRQDNLALLKETIESSPDTILACDALGNTLLHQAARHGSLECLDFLLDSDIDADAINTLDGDTALHLAVKHAREDKALAKEMVDFLVDAGADTSIRNRHGDTAADLTDDSDIKDVLATAAITDQMIGDVVDADDLASDAGEESE